MFFRQEVIIMTTFDKILAGGIITIIRGLSPDCAEKTVEAIHAGGLHLAEITFDQTAPPKVTADIIRTLSRQFEGKVLIGAGTVMTLEQLHAAYNAGAAYIISPNADSSVIRETKRLGLLSMPGAYTATEVARCYAEGADIVKVFPSDSAGPGYIKALRGPLHHIPLAAVGGVNLDNIRDFFDAGACCVGIGSNIVSKQAVQAGDFDRIRLLAAAYAAKL
ncbi:2-dehydro-3-deoxyphosphogluconate aldolase/4-hydroxy-2-oxoglutarate aldolase [Hungatella hathewayi DSM 13479]|jgi:2-dehydro-3-deoxyphosphogluconate aldolase / (4S)-4-hydroxy-2-oxoglutarate aldolase|uniref:2-dehydro-3-deoxyphosphogluconate aldolase/4-hydroxy-2-oxoglutarate aldolase n=2 Tax=Lachnospiraceae TaxID=186803 RepID=D3AH16_9FIRM|nr:2-dehydro-3-deoxyphosphogluconate aldolase/4-hydroxy-2-oxoglutarate aldolase [Hungatella hathewayi DSM 13479]RHB66999.1 bifunctional 4-hydroxy-2-oxoglutarate aldolase/2-dehydro-3-deoxy-phosphogluconate aldolase [Hungatella hathewayi]